MQSTRHERGGPATLRDFFLGPPSDWQARFVKMAEGQQTSSGQGSALSTVDRPVLINNVADKLKDALAVDLDQVLVAAWSKHKALAADLEESRKAKEETILVPLADHTIRSTHSPSVEVMVNDRRVAAFKFSANVLLRIQGAVLKLQAGQITGVEAGSWQGIGQLKCGTLTLVEHETKEFRLPTTFARPKAKPAPAPGRRPAPEPKPAAEGRTGFRAPHWQR